MVVQLVEFIQLLVPLLKSNRKDLTKSEHFRNFVLQKEKVSDDIWSSSDNQFYNQASSNEKNNFGGLVIKISVEKFFF